MVLVALFFAVAMEAVSPSGGTFIHGFLLEEKLLECTIGE
jgi:hypothetical protein